MLSETRHVSGNGESCAWIVSSPVIKMQTSHALFHQPLHCSCVCGWLSGKWCLHVSLALYDFRCKVRVCGSVLWIKTDVSIDRGAGILHRCVVSENEGGTGLVAAEAVGRQTTPLSLQAPKVHLNLSRVQEKESFYKMCFFLCVLWKPLLPFTRFIYQCLSDILDGDPTVRNVLYCDGICLHIHINTKWNTSCNSSCSYHIQWIFRFLFYFILFGFIPSISILVFFFFFFKLWLQPAELGHSWSQCCILENTVRTGVNPVCSASQMQMAKTTWWAAQVKQKLICVF